jgi:hypothetical protein
MYLAAVSECFGRSVAQISQKTPLLSAIEGSRKKKGWYSCLQKTTDALLGLVTLSSPLKECFGLCALVRPETAFQAALRQPESVGSREGCHP